jgi:hypothetical protein
VFEIARAPETSSTAQCRPTVSSTKASRASAAMKELSYQRRDRWLQFPPWPNASSSDVMTPSASRALAPR